MPILTRGAFAKADTAQSYHTGSWRVQKPQHHHFAAPCHSACPAGEDAQAWLARFTEGHARQAWELLVTANPLPGISGRVCHHPCEQACNRGQYDSSVAIHHIERYLGEQAILHQWAYPCSPPDQNAPSIAVVGAGPSGLSAAWQLLRQGYQIDLLDALPVAGGLLHMALPPYRLPRHAMQAEIDHMLSLAGINFRPQQRLGRDFSLQELHHQYPAVFLAIGKQASTPWHIDGVSPHHLQSGLDMLKEWVAMNTLSIPDRIAIIGGGNTAVDLARILRRTGAREVHLITHQAHPDSGEQDCMKAIPREIHQAEEEGVILHTQRGIQRLLLRGEQVIGVEMTRIQFLQHSNGTAQRLAFQGTETVLHVDQVIPAIGQQLQTEALDLLSGVSNQGLTVDHQGASSHLATFAGGDMRINSQGSVSAAIGDGRRAALAIHHYLQKQHKPELLRTTLPLEKLNLHYYQSTPRTSVQRLDLATRMQATGMAEVEPCFSTEQARQEAQRCFSCGNCMACDNCWTFCPDSAILKTREQASDGSHYVFDYDYCKGCGICENECPCGYIIMQEED